MSRWENFIKAESMETFNLYLFMIILDVIAYFLLILNSATVFLIDQFGALQFELVLLIQQANARESE